MDWNCVLLTKNHYREHDEGRYCITDIGEIKFCFICAVNILESPDEFVVRKKHVLNEVLSLLALFKCQTLINLMEIEDEVIVSRLLITLIGLITNGDEQMANMSMDGAVKFLHVLECDDIVNNILAIVIEMLDWRTTFLSIKNVIPSAAKQILLCQSQDQIVCLPFLRLIHNLLKAQKSIAKHVITIKEGQFIRFMESAITSISKDETKHLIVCVLINLVDGLGWIPSLQPLAVKVPQEILRVLHLTQCSELKINGLILLRLMIGNPLLLKMLFETNDKGATFPLVIKRHLLNVRDRQVRLLCIQCVNDVLQSNMTDSLRDQYTESLLQNDLATFLFESFSIADEVILESALTCCILLTDVAAFFNGCHAIYGFQAIVRSVDISFEFANVQPTILAMELMERIFKRQMPGSALFCNALSVFQVLEMLKKGLQSPLKEVSFLAAKTFSTFLRKQHLLNPIPFESIGCLVQICVKWIKQHQQTAKLPIKSFNNNLIGHVHGAIQVTLQVLVSALHLCIDCQDDPISIEENYDVPSTSSNNADDGTDLDKFKQDLVIYMDDVFIPLIQLHSDLLNTAEIFQRFFKSLSMCLRLQSSSDAANSFSIKLVSLGFLHYSFDSDLHFQCLTKECADDVFRIRNEFIEYIIIRLISIEHSCITMHPSSFSQSEQVLVALTKLIHEGLANMKSLLLTCEDYLDHRQDPSVKTTFLMVCYYSRLYGHKLIPATTLLMVLTNHLLTSQTVLNGFDEKFIFFLMATVSYEFIETEDDAIESGICNFREATQILVKEIRGMKDPTKTYTHHRDLLRWIFTLDEVAGSIGNCMFVKCIYRSTTKDSSNNDTDVVVTMMNENERFAEMFMTKLLDENDPVLAVKIFQLLELFLERECSEIFKKHFLLMAPKILSYFMVPNNHQVDSIKAVELVLQLLSQNLHFNDDDYLLPMINDFNILIQVDKAIQWLYHNNNSKTMLHALQCLNSLLYCYTHLGDCRVVTILMTRSNLLCTMASIVSSKYSESEMIKEAIIILSLLLFPEPKTGLTFGHIVTVSFEGLRRGLFSSEKLVVLGCLQIINSQLKTEENCYPCIHLNGVSNMESESSESGIRFEDLTVITATLFNLIVKEQSNPDVKNAILNCLLDIYSFTQIKHGSLVYELGGDQWTALTITKLVNRYADINDFKFIAKVFKYVRILDAGSDVWMDVFTHLLDFFEDANMNSSTFFKDIEFMDIKLEILHNLSDMLQGLSNYMDIANRVDKLLQQTNNLNPSK